MPIIINEIVFKGTITGANGERRPTSRPRPDANQALIDRQAIVQACVEEVLKILEHEKER